MSSARSRQVVEVSREMVPEVFPPDKLFSKEAIAEIVGVPPRRVLRWWDDRRLGWVRLPGGRDRRSTGAHLNEWLARSESAGQAD